MIRGCAIILGTFLGLLPDFWVPFWTIPGFFGIIFLLKFDFFKNNPDFGVLILVFPSMTLWNVACRALVSYFLLEKCGNSKRIECLSNDSTVLVFVLLYL